MQAACRLPGRPPSLGCADGRPAGRTLLETDTDLGDFRSPAGRISIWRRTHAQPFPWPDAVRQPWPSSSRPVVPALPRARPRRSAPARRVAAPSARRRPRPSASAPRRRPRSSDLKIGVVTDIGTLNDKNYNEYSFKGAEEGATAIGAAAPTSIVPTSASEYAAVDQVVRRPEVRRDRDGRLQPRRRATVQAARRNPDTTFIGVDQSPDLHHRRRHRRTSRSPARAISKTLAPELHLARVPGGPGRLPRRDRGRRSRRKSGDDRRHRRHQHLRPVRSLHPGLRARRQVGQARASRSSAPTSRTTSRAAAFQDQAGGKTFAENFLAQNKDVDVLFQVAGLTGNGVLDAACAANINGIGVDVDQFLSYPNAAPVPPDERREAPPAGGVRRAQGGRGRHAHAGRHAVRREERRHRRLAGPRQRGARGRPTPRPCSTRPSRA